MSKRDKIFRTVRYLLIAGILIMIPVFIYEGIQYKKALDEYNSIPEMSDIPEAESLPVTTCDPGEWPKDSLFLEPARASFDYKKDELRLIIPKLALNEAVVDGTSAACLKQGPGLYDVAQMPGEGDRNTSIAGHRAGISKYGNIFKYIHTLEEGDLLYLVYEDNIYTYLYRDTQIVEPKDSYVLLLQGYPCLTLTSCHPLGDNKQRIVVTSELAEITPYSDGFRYKERQED